MGLSVVTSKVFNGSKGMKETQLHCLAIFFVLFIVIISSGLSIIFCIVFVYPPTWEG